jgi:hypothetical protein
MAHIVIAGFLLFQLVIVIGILLALITGRSKKSPPQPVEKAPQRQWIGKASEYEIVLLRKGSPLIDERVRVKELSAINPRIRLARAQGQSGYVMRTVGHVPMILVAWEGR